MAGLKKSSAQGHSQKAKCKLNQEISKPEVFRDHDVFILPSTPPKKVHMEEGSSNPTPIPGLACSGLARMEASSPKASSPVALGPTGWKAPSLHLPAQQSSWQARLQLSQGKESGPGWEPGAEGPATPPGAEKGSLHQPLSIL